MASRRLNPLCTEGIYPQSTARPPGRHARSCWGLGGPALYLHSPIYRLGLALDHIKLALSAVSASSRTRTPQNRHTNGEGTAAVDVLRFGRRPEFSVGVWGLIRIP